MGREELRPLPVSADAGRSRIRPGGKAARGFESVFEEMHLCRRLPQRHPGRKPGLRAEPSWSNRSRRGILKKILTGKTRIRPDWVCESVGRSNAFGFSNISNKKTESMGLLP